MYVTISIDYRKSLFSLRDSRRKPTSEGVGKSPAALKGDVRVESASETTLTARHTRHVSTRQAILHLLACSFTSTIPSGKRDCS